MIKKNNQFSLDEKILKKILTKTHPSCQLESLNNSNLGFGFIYYSLSRLYRPKNTIVIGSTKGFSPICFGLGIKDNNNDGKLTFIDAGFSDKSNGVNKGMGGIGFWKQKNSLNIFKKFKLDKIINLQIKKTSDFLKKYDKKPIDILFIDADHTYNGFKYDFENFSQFLNPNGIIIFHDVLVEKDHDNRDFGIKNYFKKEIIPNRNFEYFRFPFWPGIAIIRKISNQEYLNTINSNNSKIIDLESKLNKIYTSKTWKILYLYKNFLNIPKKIVTNILKNKIFIVNDIKISQWVNLKELRLLALKENPKAFADIYDEEIKLSDEIWKDKIKNIKNKNILASFAIKGQKIIGIVEATKNFDDIKNNSITLCRLYVNPENRNKGLSIKLINSIIKQIKKQKIKEIQLFVSNSQKPAINLYKKTGFIVISKKSIIFKDNKKHKGLIMKKII